MFRKSFLVCHEQQVAVINADDGMTNSRFMKLYDWLYVMYGGDDRVCMAPRKPVIP